MSEKLDLVHSESKKVYKYKKGYSGNKIQALLSIMRTLEQAMIKNKATLEDIMKFEKDFLEENGISVPLSFFGNQNVNQNIEDYISEFLMPDDSNIKANDVYRHYLKICKNNNILAVKKHDFYERMRAFGYLYETGTVNGRTFHNVIKGVKFIDG